jgi:hypothetical protein
LTVIFKLGRFQDFLTFNALVQEGVLTCHSGIGLETCILFAKEGANVVMADISAPALDRASAKLKQLVPSAHKVDIKVIILTY